jgi:Flp pilus assembly protein TadD
VKQGKLEEALSYYGTALTEEPSAVVYDKLGVALMQLGRTDEAAEQFRKAIAMNPGYTEASSNLAAIH